MGQAFAFDCMELDLASSYLPTYPSSLTSDFAHRDKLLQTEIPQSSWSTCCGSWGPCPLSFPKVVFESGIQADSNLLRQRVAAAAQKYVGLAYKHKHIPAMGGLDCSNFTAWVYNFALGIRFSSQIKRQAHEAGRRLKDGEVLQKGDLLFLWDEKLLEITHVAIYLDENLIIDSTVPKVAVRPFAGEYKRRFAWARRVIE